MDEIATIEEFENKYQDEWILVEVLEEDNRNLVKKAKLLMHSKAKEEIDEFMMKYDGYTYTFFAGEKPKKGYAFAF